MGKLQVKAYGVLGRGQAARGPSPGQDMAILDPARLTIVKTKTPDSAGGTARAIYDWLGIHHTFRQALKDALQQWGDAKYEAYGSKHVVHVASPVLTGVESASEARHLLAKAYNNVLREFLQQGVGLLTL